MAVWWPAVGSGGAILRAQSPLTGTEGGRRGLTVPGLYATRQACAGQPVVDVFLMLYPDSLFTLRQTHRGRACEEEIAFLYMGRWTLSSDGREVRLLGAVASPRRFVVVDRRTLRIADEPRSITDSVAAWRTGRPVRLLPFREPFRLRGLVYPDPAVGT
jgi:hypothetical protein